MNFKAASSNVGGVIVGSPPISTAYYGSSPVLAPPNFLRKSTDVNKPKKPYTDIKQAVTRGKSGKYKEMIEDSRVNRSTTLFIFCFISCCR